ncbi:hypothetical protein NDU88_001622 [Pleurodeles waltl]|uniref:Uncharacterized protein n=1 Tax=Pleurodeles waltl TaxID=8319 RepID=A0AAV7M1N8_PLEWA|nr:hypothetical protein NDU88_001622 [Pleurodeles waltl]
MGGSTTVRDSDTGATESAWDGDSTGLRCLASSDNGGSPQVKPSVGSRSLDVHQTVSCIAGGSPQVSVFCVGGNALAAVSEGEIDGPLYAPGSQSNVGLAQEVVTGAGYCEQAAAVACLLPSTDPATPACTPEATRDHRQGRGDLLVQGEPGENFFSLSDQSQDSDEDSTCPSIDSETGDSSTAPLTPISALRGTVVKRQAKQTEVLRRDKAGESSQKREKKKKKVSRSRAMSWDYTETQQLLHSMGDLSVAPAQTEVNVLNVETVPPSPSLHLIYQTITTQHKQTQRDSKKARVATKQLRVAVSKVAKTCSEIGERIAAIECRADALESDLGVVSKQAAMHESQLSDIQWKIEDFENRQRRNNLRLIGIQEGITVVKAKIIQLYLDEDIIKAQIRTQECYELSERVGKVLAYKTRQKTARSAILAIKDRLGQMVYGDTLVLQVFKEYYSALYQQENLFSDERDERMAQYLSDMSSPKLPQEEGSMSVTRCCIASDWLEASPPTFNHWLARMCSLFYLEMGSYACKGRGRKRMGEAIWAPFAQWLSNN